MRLWNGRTNRRTHKPTDPQTQPTPKLVSLHTETGQTTHQDWSDYTPELVRLHTETGQTTHRNGSDYTPKLVKLHTGIGQITHRNWSDYTPGLVRLDGLLGSASFWTIRSTVSGCLGRVFPGRVLKNGESKLTRRTTKPKKTFANLGLAYLKSKHVYLYIFG